MNVINILFLDIDGVLNTSTFRDTFGNRCHPKKIELLGDIVLQTGCKIVITSDWRFGGIGPGSDIWSAIQCKAFVDKPPENTINAILDSIIDKTFDLDDGRSAEILSWVKTCDYQVNKFVVIDDKPEIVSGIDSKHLVITDDDIGLTESIAQDVIKRLT